jgi:Tol biopolymer transport system component
VEKGSSVLADFLKGSSRNLYLINLAKGTIKPLTHSGIEHVLGGVPWSEKNQQFLYVVKTSGRYQLNALTIPTGKSIKILSSSKPILSPSWVSTGYQIAYVDGICERPYVYDLELKTSKALFSDDEKAQIVASGGKKKMGLPAIEVIPSPDSFRYLFKCQKGDVTVLETALADGSKANEIYRSFHPIDHLSWMDFSQKIIFEEKGRQAMYLIPSKNIQIEDANQCVLQYLIWPQISHHSPAPTPDGVKVAFVGSSGLWYPSLGLSESSGIWVAVLR